MAVVGVIAYNKPRQQQQQQPVSPKRSASALSESESQCKKNKASNDDDVKKSGNNELETEMERGLADLDQALVQEAHSKIVIHQQEDSAITCGMRDGSAHVLRCLKVWYDLPADVFFAATAYIDRFLAKMKAQPKHLSCIAVSAFHLACLRANVAAPDPSDLVTISQSRCSSSDLLRMQAIVKSKLELNDNRLTTPLTFLRRLHALVYCAALSLGLKHGKDKDESGETTAKKTETKLIVEKDCEHLVSQLEILNCSSATLRFRPAEVALALLAADLQTKARAFPQFSHALMGIVEGLQKSCRIASASFIDCLGLVVQLLDKYHGEGSVIHRQRLIWKLSNRTLRHLRPTDKLRFTLPTINEAQQQDQQGQQRARSNSECSDGSLVSLSSSDSTDEQEP